MMDILCKISTYDIIDDCPNPFHSITIRNVDNINKRNFIYIEINNTTILVDGKELIDGIQRCLI